MTDEVLMRIVGPVGVFLLLLLPSLLYVWLKYGPRRMRDRYHDENQTRLVQIGGTLVELTAELRLHNGRLKVVEERGAGHEALDVEREKHATALIAHIERTMRDLHETTRSLLEAAVLRVERRTP